MVLYFSGKRKSEIVNNCKPIDKRLRKPQDLAIHKKLAQGAQIMKKMGR
jgi:hypothetical protein